MKLYGLPVKNHSTPVQLYSTGSDKTYFDYLTYCMIVASTMAEALVEYNRCVGAGSLQELKCLKTGFTVMVDIWDSRFENQVEASMKR